MLCSTSLSLEPLVLVILTLCGEAFCTSASFWRQSSCPPGKMRPLHRAESRGLVETLLNHSFGHHFKQNINQSRSVWAKAEICREDLQTWENAVQFLHLTLKPKLATIWSPLQKLSTAPTRHLFSNTSFKLYAIRRCEFPLYPALWAKKWLWLLCLEVYVHFQKEFAEEQNLFHCVAGGRKYLWSVPVLI